MLSRNRLSAVDIQSYVLAGTEQTDGCFFPLETRMLLGGKDGCALVVRLWEHIRDILRVVRPASCLLRLVNNRLVCAFSRIHS